MEGSAVAATRYARGQFRIGLRIGVDSEGILDGEDDDSYKLHYLEAGWAARLVGAHERHGRRNCLDGRDEDDQHDEGLEPPSLHGPGF